MSADIGKIYMRFFSSIFKVLTFRDRFLFRHFLLLYSVHFFMKIFLGIYLINKLNYTSPLFYLPLSLILTGGDVIVLFILVKFGNLFKRFPIIFFIYEYALFVPVYYYAVKGYIIYLYFHGFVNYGLDMFLGSKGNETVNFVFYALDLWGWCFFAALFISAVIYIVFFYRPGKSCTVGEKRAVFSMNILAVFSLVIISFLPDKITGSLHKNPLFEVAWTYVTMPKYLYYYKTVDEAFDPYKLPTDKQTPSITKSEPEKHVKKNTNILLIVVESLSANTLYNDIDGKKATPTLQNLMQNSFRFSSYRTFFPGSTRSFIGMFCGTFSSTGWRSVTRYRRDVPCISLIELLNKSGYRSGFFTPVSMDYDALGSSSVMNSFDSFVDSKELRRRYTSQKKFGTGNAVEEELAVQSLEEFIRSDSKPFFAVQYMYWTHAPYEHPFRNLGRLDNRTRYIASLSYIDSVIKKILHILKQNKADKNTILVITADHGQAFGEHTGNYTHSNYLYDESIRIPLIIHYPDSRIAVIDKRGTHADLAPTILDILGLSSPSKWQGASLFSKNKKHRPDLIFTRSIKVHNGIIFGSWKYFYNLRNDKEYLFNLVEDPKEQNNLAAKYPEKCIELRELSDLWAAWQHLYFFSMDEKH